MATSPLFYHDVIALDRERHRDFRIAVDGRAYGFCKSSHMIPAVVDEYVPACRELPIVFVPDVPLPGCVFLTGLHPGRNDFVRDDWSWMSPYLPAYLRRYPLILGEAAGREPIVCISAGATGSTGERLFDESGHDTPFLQQSIAFLQEFRNAAQRTEEFVRLLQDNELLRGVTLEVKRDGGDNAVIHGLLAINEDRLAALSEAAFGVFRKKNYVGAIYAHLISLRSMDRLGLKSQA